MRLKPTPLIDYCRDRCGEIKETDVLCLECGMRLRFDKPRRMSVGKWIGWQALGPGFDAVFPQFASRGGFETGI